jgi:uncharacterized damage-inducible protein DinB
MKATELIRQQFDDELNATRDVLACVPEDKLDFKPHEKSMTLNRLAGHTAELLEWAIVTIDQDGYEVASGGKPTFTPYKVTTTQALLDYFDEKAAATRAGLATLDEAKLETPWTLMRNGKAVFTLPRWQVLVKFNLSHIVHHRAQLGVYLRMNHIPIPGMYGPSQDDMDAMAK